MEWVGLIKDLGFPIFVALFVLVRLEPAIKHLDGSITALTIVAAKTNGMKDKDIAYVIDAVASRKKQKRRAADRLGE